MKMHYEINEFKTLKYITAYPDGYSKGKKYPIIFFLHGAGTRYILTARFLSGCKRMKMCIQMLFIIYTIMKNYTDKNM